MQTTKAYANNNKLSFNICQEFGQSIVEYRDNAAKKDWKFSSCDNCKKTFDIKITTYNRINKKMQPAVRVLRRCSPDGLL